MPHKAGAVGVVEDCLSDGADVAPDLLILKIREVVPVRSRRLAAVIGEVIPCQPQVAGVGDSTKQCGPRNPPAWCSQPAARHRGQRRHGDAGSSRSRPYGQPRLPGDSARCRRSKCSLCRPKVDDMAGVPSSYLGGYLAGLAALLSLVPSVAAERWARESRKFIRQLESRNLSLEAGIGIVREWVSELRRCLAAMDAMDEPPASDGGGFPTPTTPTPATVAQLPDKLLPFVERMEAVIKRVGEKKPKELIKEAGMNPSTARKALRWLESQDKYHSFGKDKSARYGNRNRE